MTCKKKLIEVALLLDAINKVSAREKWIRHGHPSTLHLWWAGLIVGAVNGKDKDELLSDHYTPVPGYWKRRPLAREIDDIASGSFKRKDPPDIRGTGYVVQSLEAALWAFYHGNSFKEGCLLAVNLGDDADTTGAVYGQLAGAFYGEDGIPKDWREKVSHHELFVSYGEKLLCHDRERSTP
jgi:ADP-ribosyl-[dinitrogen reductase] hydrolase